MTTSVQAAREAEAEASIRDGRGELRQNAYYYHVRLTGDADVDALLAAVATAGKAYHNTEDWNDKPDGRLSVVEVIQHFADQLAARRRNDRTALLDEAKRRVEEMKYDRTVEGHNGFEASVWDGAMNTVLATLTSMTTEQTDG